MKISFPAYYRQFSCIASACPDSCCKEWEVDVDASAAAYYRSLPGDLGDRLRQVLRDTEDGTVMTIEDGRCPMWRQDGLCRIQAALGHDALCQTCRDFPRLRHDYGDFMELGLELSCPEAARLILSAAPSPMLTEEAEGGEAPVYDDEAMSVLLRSRQTLLAFLDETDYTVPQALAVMLLYGHAVQSELDGGEPAQLHPEALLADARKFAKTGDLKAVFDFFKDLEILTPQWQTRLEQGAVSFSWEAPVRALARYMVGRYWLQTVSDYDLICRVKLTVIACVLVNAMGGDVVQTAQLFSKEIENDPNNVEAILDGAYRSPAFTDINLLSLLLENK